jgi:hypothetical protein
MSDDAECSAIYMLSMLVMTQAGSSSLTRDALQLEKPRNEADEEDSLYCPAAPIVSTPVASLRKASNCKDTALFMHLLIMLLINHV